MPLVYESPYGSEAEEGEDENNNRIIEGTQENVDDISQKVDIYF